MALGTSCHSTGGDSCWGKGRCMLHCAYYKHLLRSTPVCIKQKMTTTPRCMACHNTHTPRRNGVAQIARSAVRGGAELE